MIDICIRNVFNVIIFKFYVYYPVDRDHLLERAVVFFDSHQEEEMKSFKMVWRKLAYRFYSLSIISCLFSIKHRVFISIGTYLQNSLQWDYLLDKGKYQIKKCQLYFDYFLFQIYGSFWTVIWNIYSSIIYVSLFACYAKYILYLFPNNIY